MKIDFQRMKTYILALLILLVILVSSCVKQQDINKGDEVQKNKVDNNIIMIQDKEVSIQCNSDDDCFLINRDIGLSCCWEGACEEIDYSLDRYVAVNQDSFHSLRIKECPWVEDKAKRYEKCGPAPGCPIAMINDNFVAKCINNICTKVPK